MSELGNTDNKIECLSDVFVTDRNVYESTLPQKKSGILRTIKGPVAEWDKLNRNARKYSEKLWDKSLASSYVKEQLKYKTLYGEANHPTDRYEVDFARVSHSITELWKVPSENQIYATINILDTPFGNILNTLYEAGGVLGYSTRAGGILNQKKDYIEVDENAFNFITIDAVPYPSVKAARPDMVVEGKENIEKFDIGEEYHKKICDIINESNEENKEVIKSLIYSLKGFEMEKEIAILENPVIPCKNELEEKHTLSLLKESSLYIDDLKAKNLNLQASNKSLEKENKKLKENLNSSLLSFTKTLNEAKDFENKATINKSETNNTIINYRLKLGKLEGKIMERDLELEELVGVKEAFKALENENKLLKESVDSKIENAILQEKNRSENITKEKISIERELKEACKEISEMVIESNELQNNLKDYKAKYDVLLEAKTKLENDLENNQIAVNESKGNQLATQQTRKINSLVSQKEKMQSRIEALNGSLAQKEESLVSLSNLSSENEDLRNEIVQLNESMKIIENKSRSYKNDLISVICSNYNLNVANVKKQLPVGFTKSDVYAVCEQMNNCASRGIDYTNVVSDSIVTQNKNINENKKAPTVAISKTLFNNRRGVKLSN